MITKTLFFFVSFACPVRKNDCIGVGRNRPYRGVFVVNNLHSSIGAKRHDCCGQKSTPTFRDRDVAPTKGRMQFAPTKKSSVTSVVNHLVEFSG